METLQVGDIVELKSGGPAMTVSEFQEQLAEALKNDRVICDWFASGKLSRMGFTAKSLVKVSEA